MIEKFFDVLEMFKEVRKFFREKKKIKDQTEHPGLEAKKEARRDGATTIELVDGETLVKCLSNLNLA